MRDEEIQHSGEDDLPINNDRRSGVYVALPFRSRLISFRYGQSWLWNGFGCDVGFMVKASCRHAPGGVLGVGWLLAAGKKRRKDPAPKR